MAEWTKDGSYPGALPAVDYADGLSYTGLEGSAEARGILGWVEAPPRPAYDGATHRLDWDGGDWILVPLPPVEPPPAEPVRIRKYWLFERFTEEQERRFAKLEYRARNLTDTDLDDPAKERLFQFQRFLRRLDAIDVVELDAAQTLGVFELMRLEGVFGDPESPDSIAALAPILAAPQPHEVV